MAKIEQYSRIINHAISTSGQTFTVPSSNDHTDETWLATDLYIGELGVNVTDDKVFVRTNNGIIQLATGTSSTGTTSSIANVFQFNSPNIQIGTTYSADSVSPRSGYYTDLGTSTFRWKDLYLGGSATTNTTINTNGGLWLRQSTDSILVTGNVASTNAPIEIGITSSTTSKNRGLFLNSKSSSILGSPEQNSIISSNNVIITGGGRQVVSLGGADTTFASSLTHSVVIGYGYGKTQSRSLDVVAGGGLSVRGISDDGTTQYSDSDWITKQARLRTTSALVTNIASIPWSATASGGSVVQIKGYLVASDINDPGLIYSSEITGVYSVNDNNVVYEIGIPVISEWSTWPSSTITTEMGADTSGAYIKVKGDGSSTMQWLCTYSYHRIINIV